MTAFRRAQKPPGWHPKRGDVCLFSLDKERPAVVVSADFLNIYSFDICIVPISKVEHKAFSLRPRLRAGDGGLRLESWAKCDQVTTLEKAKAVYPPLGTLSAASMERITGAVKLSLDIV